MNGPSRKRRRLSPRSHNINGHEEPSWSDFASDSVVAESRPHHWDAEQAYEQRQHKLNKKQNESTRLPIKTAEGRLQQLQAPEPEEDADSWLDSAEEDENGDSDQESEAETAAAPKISMRQQIIETKEELARIAMLINEDPEEHAGSFKKLADIAASSNVTVKKLAIATQSAVYRDIIPGYRIRSLSEDAMTDKVSKDVKRLRNFEQSLVTSYQRYVKELEILAKGKRGEENGESAGLTTIAISCACALLIAVPHFNFRNDLIKILVDRLSGRKLDGDFLKCKETIHSVFQNDDDGTISLEVVTQLTKMMKARDYRVDESVLDTFLHLRLLSEFSSKASRDKTDKSVDDTTIQGRKPKQKKEFRTKKQRKIEKERKQVEKEMKEADAIVSHEERDRMQGETLKLVFITYFRILKTRVPTLMGAVLEGLAKYAHLINQDFFGDLLEVLRDLVGQYDGRDIEESEESDSTSARNITREALLCISTAFALLEGQDASAAASTLHLDLNFFISSLYTTLYPLSLNPDIERNAKSLHLPDPDDLQSQKSNVVNRVNVQTTIVLLLRCLSSVLLPPKSVRAVPPLRLAAYTKQILTSSLHLPEKSCLASIGLMNRVSKIHGKKISALWHTEERKGDGVFDPLRSDLEGSNPFASTVWEGEILRRHFCPEIRESIKILEGIIESGR